VQIASRIGPSGTLYADDIDRGALEALRRRSANLGFTHRPRMDAARERFTSRPGSGSGSTVGHQNRQRRVGIWSGQYLMRLGHHRPRG
jgi:hypothetical protein